MRFRITYANVVSTLALIIALSGGAYAATGGSLILGRGNSASSLTGVTNSKGVAFSFHSKSGSAPFTVRGNGVKVSSLNADKVDGLDSTQLRGQTGATGPAGPAGPAGPTGPQGAAGTDGVGLPLLFGDGSDGAAAFDGTTTPAGTTRSGSTYTLGRDVYYTTAELTNNVIVKTNGYRLFAKSSLSVDSGSAIRHDGSNASGRSGGNGAPNGTLRGGDSGYSGGFNGFNSSDGGEAIPYIGGNSGAGGSGSSGGVGSGPTPNTSSLRPTDGSPHNWMQAVSVTNLLGERFVGAPGGPGGNGSGPNNGSTGGGGGGGAGIVGIYTPSLALNGTITARGGDGAAASSGNAGGGAGAAGGAVILVYFEKTGSGSVDVSGGAGASGSGSGGSGSAGGPGNIYELTV